MRRNVVRLLCIAVLAVPVVTAVAQLPMPQTSQNAETPSPLESIAWMAGSWVADAKPPGNGKASRVLTRFTPQLDGRMMAMETSVDGQPVYAGMYAYDPAKKTITFWYVTPSGESIRGTVMPHADDQLYDIVMTLVNGIELHFQTKVHRIDMDHYTWALFTTINKGATWDKLFEVEYHRVP
ncbi:MAG: hypothetical protein PW789_11745 [Edaphobacter sp.]|uniref:hypothetical protein n=1 Tax=Edaphobacter sp. TaxID=1934404 RepID=UPI00239D4C19|nr:hypothetical protein [Edaphobacter sp.]MDE1177259.1 hypothetical protein [Edaphobacter sp.]